MKIPAFLQGCIAPVFSVFTDNGQLDLDGQCNLLDFLGQRRPVSAYFIRSGMGQMYTFGLEETIKLFERVSQHLDSTKPMIAGCSGIWHPASGSPADSTRYTNEACDLVKAATATGMSAAVLTVPEALFGASSLSFEDEVQNYMDAVCSIAEIPIVMYQPQRTPSQCLLRPAFLAKLVDDYNIVGIKASQTDGHYVYELIRAVKDRNFAYICGNEHMLYASAFAGARAVIGQGSMLNPSLLAELISMIGIAEHETVLSIQDRINLICAACPDPVVFFKQWASQEGFKINLTQRKECPGNIPLQPKACTESEFARIHTLIQEAELLYPPESFAL